MKTQDYPYICELIRIFGEAPETQLDEEQRHRVQTLEHMPLKVAHEQLCLILDDCTFYVLATDFCLSGMIFLKVMMETEINQLDVAIKR